MNHAGSSRKKKKEKARVRLNKIEHEFLPQQRLAAGKYHAKSAELFRFRNNPESRLLGQMMMAWGTGTPRFSVYLARFFSDRRAAR